MAKIIRAWDTETTTRSDWSGRKASPWVSNNWVVASAYSDYSKEGFISAGKKIRMTRPKISYWSCGPADGWFREVLTGCDILAGANIKFDLHHALFNKPKNYAAYKRWVNDGGRIWDILHAEYILGYMRQESQMLGLEDVAVMYGGNAKVDQVKALWESGVSTEDIDRKLLLDYLAGVYPPPDGDPLNISHGDIGNTMLVAVGQLKECTKRKTMQWMKVEMLALMATIEAEMNGIVMDWEKGEEARERTVQKIDECTSVIMDAIPEEVRPHMSLSSIWDKSLILYGGTKTITVKGYLNTEGEVQETPWAEGQAYFQNETTEPVLDDKGQPVLFKSGKNAGQPKVKKVKVDDPERPKRRNMDKEFTIPRRVQPDEGTEMAKEGYWSVSADVLDGLISDDPVVTALKEVSIWIKDLGSSYYTLDKEGNREGGLWQHTGPNGIIHPTFHHNRTKTGRLSSSQPNSQNLSKVGEVKTCFVSRYKDGKVAQSDFTSLELYVGYWLTGCPGYEKLLGQGLDLHCFTAAAWSNMPYEEFYQKYKDGDKWAKQRRQDSKAVNFGMAYGAGVAKLAASTGLPPDDVKAIMEANKKAFYGYNKFQEDLLDYLNSHVHYTGDIARHPQFPTRTYQEGYATYKAPYGLEWAYPLAPAPEFVVKDTGNLATISPTQAKNFHVQGTGGSAMKAALALQLLLLYSSPRFDDIKIIGTVHDAGYWDTPGATAVIAGSMLQACMEGANEVLTACGLPVNIPVPAVTTVGDCWKEQDGDLTIDPKAKAVISTRQYITDKLLKKVFA